MQTSYFKLKSSAALTDSNFGLNTKLKRDIENGAGGRQNNLNLILPFFHPVIRFVLCSDVSQEAAGMTPQFYWKGFFFVFFFSFWSV